MSEIQSIKSRLEKFVKQFKLWLSENYTSEQIETLFIDDCAFPFWNDVIDLSKEELEIANWVIENCYLSIITK